MFARTARLMLRPGWSEDTPALSRAIGDEAVVRNLSHAPWPYAPGDAAAFLARPTDALAPECLIFTRTQGAPRLAGGIGLRRSEDNVAELGYWIARPYWGLGFATEAGHAMIAAAEQSLRITHIRAGHFLDNPASGRVLRKLGFVATGQVAARYCRARDCLVPMVLFEKTQGETMVDIPRLAA